MKSAIKLLFLAGVMPMFVACAEADSSPMNNASGDGATEASTLASAEEDHSAHLMEEPVTVAAAVADPPGSPRTIYSGVYTAAQADRGRTIQESECFVCHAADDWAGGRLLTNHTGQSMLAFVEHLRSTMPLDEPGRLEYAQYVDVAARILQLNGIPTGSGELSTESDDLAEIRVEYRR